MGKARHKRSLLLFSSLLILFLEGAGAGYLIGVGSYDMTGPAAGVSMMGYGKLHRNTARVHFQLRARAFIAAESSDGSRFAFVNLDAGMASQLVTIKVLERLRLRFGDLYTEENVAISGIHSHAGPGGYLQYMLYSVTSLGFVQQSFDAGVDAVEQSINQAHNNLKPGDVDNAGINRIPSAYLLNPPDERAQYTTNVDTQMTLLKFVDTASGKGIGAFNWFPTHGTSMSRDNLLISGDNKGAAARFFEDWLASTVDGKSVNGSGSRVRTNTGLMLLCCRYPDEILSTKIIGQRQFQTAIQLFNSAEEELMGKMDYRQAYLNLSDIKVELEENQELKTCPAALGGPVRLPARGYRDQPLLEAYEGFPERTKQVSEECQQPKPVLLSTGEMFLNQTC